MKMKQIVIEVPEEDYENRTLTGYFGAYSKQLNDVIYNGTPLPEGHGDLIDVDELLATEKPRGISDELWEESHIYIYKLLSSVTPVIKADTEDKEQEMKGKDTKKREGIEL